jgi:hypothetical protein
MSRWVVVALGLVAAVPAWGAQINTAPDQRFLERQQTATDRYWNRQQRERFHEDYESDRRVYGVNPPGHDAQGVEPDGDSGADGDGE